MTRPAYNWVPGTTALTFSNAEDGHATVTLPFSFTYYGTAYTTLNVSTNGFATFNAANQARYVGEHEHPQYRAGARPRRPTLPQ